MDSSTGSHLFRSMAQMAKSCLVWFGYLPILISPTMNCNWLMCFMCSKFRWTWIWRTTVRQIFAYDGRYAWPQSDAYQVFVICIRQILHMTDQFSWSHWVRHIQVHLYNFLTLPILRLLSSKAQFFFKPSKSFHVGIYWIAPTEYSQMSTHVPGFLSFFMFFASFCIGRISHQQRKGKPFHAWSSSREIPPGPVILYL